MLLQLLVRVRGSISPSNFSLLILGSFTWSFHVLRLGSNFPPRTTSLLVLIGKKRAPLAVADDLTAHNLKANRIEYLASPRHVPVLLICRLPP